MSVVALVANRTRSRLDRIALPAEVIGIGLLALFALATAVLTWGTWGALDNDTGHDFVAGSRVAAGELPYVDFPYWYGPLAPALLGLAAWIGGDEVSSYVVLGFAIAAAIVAAGYALARLVAGPLAAALATALTVPVAFAPNQFSYVLPHTTAATLGLLCVLGVLLALGASAYTPHRDGAVFAAGICAGLVGLTKPEFELAAITAAAAWFVLARRRGRVEKRAIAIFAAPALALPVLVYGAFLTAVSPRELVFENLYPSDFLTTAGNTLLEARAPLAAGSVAEVVVRLALYAAGAALLVLLARGLAGTGPARLAARAVAGAAVVAAAGGSIANPEALRHGLQFAWGWIPAGALVAAVVVLLRIRRGHVEARLHLAALAALAAFAATTYAGFFFHAPNAQTAVYVAPLAAAFVARLHMVDLARTRHARAVGGAWLAFLALAGAGLTLKDARVESAVVSGPGGSLHAAPADAQVYRQALALIEQASDRGDAILVAPQMTWMYTLAQRANPLPDISLLPGALGGAEGERAAIAALERKSVAVAVIDRRTFPVFDHSSFGGSFNRGIDEWVRRSLAHAATLRSDDVTLEVWWRRTT